MTLTLNIPAMGIALVGTGWSKKRIFYKNELVQSYILPEQFPSVVQTTDMKVISIGFGIGILILTRMLGPGIKVLNKESE